LNKDDMFWLPRREREREREACACSFTSFGLYFGSEIGKWKRELLRQRECDRAKISRMKEIERDWSVPLAFYCL
jgi:hypothetical protein